LAVATGVDERSCFCLVDGEVLKIEDGQARRGASVPVGRILIDGAVVGDVDDSVLRDRRHISEDGVAMVILAVSRQTGEIVVGPDFVTRGLLAPDQHESNFDELKKLVIQRVSAMPRAAIADEAELQEHVRQTVRRYFRKKLGRRPVVVPYILEL
jgi:ribonuclease J